MTSLTERFPAAQPQSVSPEGSATAGIAPLDSNIYRDMRWCARCAGEQLFIEVFACDAGRLGVCMGCGEEKFVGWSRTNSEAA